MELAADSVLHVAEVYPNSPAATAGLEANNDFIIGNLDGPFLDLEDFAQSLRTNKQLPIMVYNLKQDKVREVVVIPNEHWGGKGMLGCDLADGALHKIEIHKKPAEAMPAEDVATTPEATDN
jgi:hypothetical protein